MNRFYCSIQGGTIGCAVLGPIQMAKYDMKHRALLTLYEGLDVSVVIIARDDYCLTLGHTVYYDTTELTGFVWVIKHGNQRCVGLSTYI